MKILIETFHSPYTGERVGGAETSLKLLADELSKRGHHVTFFSKSYSKTWLGYKKKSVNGVDVYIFTKFKLGLLNAYKIKKITHFFKNRFIKSMLTEIDIVHTYNNIGIVKYYAKTKSKFNYKLVVRMAGLKLFEDFETKPHLKHVYEEYFPKIDVYNFITEGLRELVIQKSKEFNLNVNFEPYFVKDIGVNIIDLPQKKINISESHANFKIVMASRLSKFQKRQDILIKAMKYLREHPVSLTIIGDGPTKSDLQNLAEVEQVAEKVKFLRFSKAIWNDLVEYDLLVHACDYEGLSKIIIESMAVGLPVLCSDVLPLKNYIKHQQNGFLVENDPKSWANAIVEIMNNKMILASVSKKSKIFINENYVSSKNVISYENQFQNLVSCADY